MGVLVACALAAPATYVESLKPCPDVTLQAVKARVVDRLAHRAKVQFSASVQSHMEATVGGGLSKAVYAVFAELARGSILAAKGLGLAQG